MAPASPELGIIVRLWAVSKGALMVQHEDTEGNGLKEGVRTTRPRQEETEGKGGVTERRKGFHVGDDEQKAHGSRQNGMSQPEWAGWRQVQQRLNYH